MSAKAAAKGKGKAKAKPKPSAGVARAKAKGRAKGKGKGRGKGQYAGYTPGFKRLGGRKDESEDEEDIEPVTVMDDFGMGFLGDGLLYLMEGAEGLKEIDVIPDVDMGLGDYFGGSNEFELTVDAGVDSLGMTPVVPPGQVIVKAVAPGGWAEENGIVVGAEIDKVNGKIAATLSKKVFMQEMKQRPLQLSMIQEGGQQLLDEDAGLFDDIFGGSAPLAAQSAVMTDEFFGAGSLTGNEEREGPKENVIAQEDVKKLGFTPRLPPGRVWIIDIVKGGWADKAGFKEGCEIEMINGNIAMKLSKIEFIEEMKERPLDIDLLQPIKTNRQGPPIELAATELVKSLGFTPRLPPGRVMIEDVKADSWAEENGLRVGCEIATINGEVAKKMSKAEFTSAMKARPIFLKVEQPEQGLIGGLFSFNMFGAGEDKEEAEEQAVAPSDLKEKLQLLAPAPMKETAKPKPRPPLPKPEAPPPPISRLRPWAPQLQAACSQRDASRFQQPEVEEGKPKPPGTTDPPTPLTPNWTLAQDRRKALPKPLSRKDVAPLRSADATLCVVNEPDAMSEPNSSSDESISGAIVRSWDPSSRDNRYLYSRDAAVPFSEPWKSLEWSQEEWVQYLKDTGSIKAKKPEEKPIEEATKHEEEAAAPESAPDYYQEDDDNQSDPEDQDYPEDHRKEHHDAWHAPPHLAGQSQIPELPTEWMPTDPEKLRWMAYQEATTSRMSTPRGLPVSRMMPVAALDPKMGGYKLATKYQGAALQEAVDMYRGAPRGVYDDLRLALERPPAFQRMQPAGIEWQMPDDGIDVPGRSWL